MLSYDATWEPPWGQDKPGTSMPEIACPDCGKLLHTVRHLHLHRLRKHADVYKEGVNVRQPAGIPIRYRLSGNAPVPPKKHANP